MDSIFGGNQLQERASVCMNRANIFALVELVLQMLPTLLNRNRFSKEEQHISNGSSQ